MEIYSDEVGLGVDRKLVYASKAIAYTPAIANLFNDENRPPKVRASANPGQPDLFYLQSVLASTGWNQNEDVFDKYETWKAKSTPVDKRFNYQHDDNDIIGHITSSSVVVDGEVYLGDDLPENYDVVVESVLYRFWDDADLQERMDTIFAEIQEGKWYVSMECIFNGFDYSLIDSEGNQKTIDRNQTTAFLSKYLKAYGGSGEYQGYKVGRLLKDFTFSGKGLVTNPANENSVIFSCQKSVAKSVASLEINMNEEALLKRIEVLQADNAKLTETLKVANAKAAVAKELETKVTATQDEIKGLRTEVEKVNKNLYDKIAEFKTLEASASTANEQLEKVNAKAEDLTKQLEIANVKILETEAQFLRSVRLASLTKAGIEGQKAEAILTKFASVPNDIFNEFVDLHKTRALEVKPPTKEEVERATASFDTARVQSSDVRVVQVEKVDPVKATAAKISDWVSKNCISFKKA